jgi:hypothetical protein
MCIIEYNNHIGAKNAIKVLNSTNTSPVYQLICNKFLQAYWAEPFIDNVKELFSANTSFFYFENLNINTYNLFHFKHFIETKTGEKIVRIRQFAQKVLIEFERCVKMSGQISYEGKIVNIIPGMHPNHNVSRYKEKVCKIVPFQLSEQDRKTVVSIVEETPIENLKKKADSLYNKLSNNDFIAGKRERDEKRPEKVPEKRRDFRDSRENSHKKDIRDSRDTRDSGRDGRDRRDRRERTPERDRKPKTKEEPQSQQVDLLSQLTTLLQGGQGINVLSGIASLNQLLTNPGLLNTIQQLTNLNKPQPTQTPIPIPQQSPNVNPVYNIKPQEPQYPPQYNVRQSYYPNQPYQYNEGNMYMPQFIDQPQPQQHMQQQQQQPHPNDLDQQMQMMKKYYEYMQSINKNNA